MIEHALGSTAALCGILSGLGVIAQIRLNWQRQSCVGLSKIRHMAQFASFSTSAAYAIIVLRDPYVMTTMSLGVLTIGTVLLQMWIYRA